MQITRSFILAASISLFSTGAFAQSVGDVINKNIDALGGRDKLTSLASLYQESTTSVMGQDMNSKTWIVSGKGMRAEVAVMGQNIIQVITKDTGWMVNPMAGSTDPQPMTKDQIKPYASRIDPRGPFLNYAANGYTATLVGSDKVNGADCFKVKLTRSGDGDQTYYIDKSTYYIDKASVDYNVQGQAGTLDIVFSDYTKTPEGYVFPNTTTISGTPQGDIVSKITKVVPNQSVDPAIFTKP
jgi:hypothetical protein